MKTSDFCARLNALLGAHAAADFSAKTVGRRLSALSKLDACSRCCGSGHYSFCPGYGTRCFRCSGSGKQLPKLTVKLARECAALIVAGGLDEYFAKAERAKAARAAIAPLMIRAEGLYRVVGDAYSAASAAGERLFWKRDKSDPLSPVDCSPLAELQRRNNEAYFTRACRIAHEAAQGRISAESAVESLIGFVTELEAIANEWRDREAAAA